MTDCVLPFRIEGTDIRGQSVRLDAVLDDILHRHDYPEPVAVLLGEGLLLAALLGASLKFDGTLTVQLQGTGAVSLVVAEYRGGGALRGTARFDAERLDALLSARTAARKGLDLPALMGTGHMALTLDQGRDMDRYQGIVTLDGPNISAAALKYFAQSEQIPTALKLAVAELLEPGGRRTWRGGGLMIQSLPPREGKRGGAAPGRATDKSRDDWQRLTLLMNTTRDVELTDPDLSPERLLYRLFHEDGVRVFKATELHFECGCTHAKIIRMLSGFDSETRAGMVQDGVITVTCEFCNQVYSIDPQEIPGE